MKNILLIFIIVLSVLGSDSLTLVGLSGKEYHLKLYSISGQKHVDPNSFLSAINIKTDRTGKRFIARYNDKKLTIKSSSTIAVINSDTISISKSGLTKQAITLTDISNISFKLTGLFFNLDSVNSIIKISKSPIIFGVIDSINATVVIDPGHGGKDPGAIGQDSTKEKDVVLSISKFAEDFIIKNSTVKVILTRSDDTFIPLRERTKIANSNNADIFISIHANASPKLDKVDGYKIYFLSDAKNETDEHLAKFENSVLELEEKDKGLNVLNSVLLDMANSEFLHQSQDLAITAESSFSNRLSKIGKLHTGIGQANFYVLNGALMPAVLVETGFISNSTEEKLLSDEKFQKKIGKAIGAAVIDYLKREVSEK